MFSPKKFLEQHQLFSNDFQPTSLEESQLIEVMKRSRQYLEERPTSEEEKVDLLMKNLASLRDQPRKEGFFSRCINRISHLFSRGRDRLPLFEKIENLYKRLFCKEELYAEAEWENCLFLFKGQTEKPSVEEHSAPIADETIQTDFEQVKNVDQFLSTLSKDSIKKEREQITEFASVVERKIQDLKSKTDTSSHQWMDLRTLLLTYVEKGKGELRTRVLALLDSTLAASHKFVDVDESLKLMQFLSCQMREREGESMEDVRRIGRLFTLSLYNIAQKQRFEGGGSLNKRANLSLWNTQGEEGMVSQKRLIRQAIQMIGRRHRSLKFLSEEARQQLDFITFDRPGRVERSVKKLKTLISRNFINKGLDEFGKFIRSMKQESSRGEFERAVQDQLLLLRVTDEGNIESIERLLILSNEIRNDPDCSTKCLTAVMDHLFEIICNAKDAKIRQRAKLEFQLLSNHVRALKSTSTNKYVKWMENYIEASENLLRGAEKPLKKLKRD